jgi:hypothetical protein
VQVPPKNIRNNDVTHTSSCTTTNCHLHEEDQSNSYRAATYGEPISKAGLFAGAGALFQDKGRHEASNISTSQLPAELSRNAQNSVLSNKQHSKTQDTYQSKQIYQLRQS